MGSDKKPTPNSQGKSEHQPQPTNPQVPFASGESDSQKGKAQYEITCKTEKTWWNSFKPIAEMVGIVLLGIYTAYTIKMYCANLTAANAAKKAADVSQQSLIASNRSWLKIDMSKNLNDINVGDDSGKKLLRKMSDISFELTFKNIGKTPAREIVIETAGEVLDRESATTFAYNKPYSVTEQHIIFPNDESPFTDAFFLPRTSPTATEKMTPPLRDDLLAGRKYIVIYARASYSDVFGKHCVKFCSPFVFAPNTYNHKNCTDYNDAGDEETPSTPQ
jgi:hypothetical protein